MKKKFVAILLILMMALCLLPVAAMAAPVSPDPNPAGNTIGTIAANDTLGINNGTVTTNNGTVTTNYGVVGTNNGTVYNYPGGIVSENSAGGTVYCMGGAMELSGGLARNDGILIIPAGYTLTIGPQLHNAGTIHNFGTIAGNGTIIFEGSGKINNYTGGVIEPTIIRDNSRVFGITSPVITAHPASQTVAVGSSAAFTAAATGGPGVMRYQWRFSSDGTTWRDIAGATGTSYAIDPVAASDAGHYACVATIELASATSNAATLTIRTPAPPPAPTGHGGGSSTGYSAGSSNEYPGAWAGGVLTVQGPCDKLASVIVDNVILTRGVDYTVQCGSTVITLTPAYLATLQNGTHAIRVQFTDGRYAGSFTTPFAASTALTVPVAAVPDTGGLAQAATFLCFLGSACCLFARKMADKRRP